MGNLKITEPLLTQFDLHHRLYNNVLDGFTDEETNQRLQSFPEINHVKYLAGHLLNSQYGLLLVSGLNPEIKWNDLFAVLGQSKAKDDYAYPHIDEILAEWNNLHEPAMDGLSKLTAYDLALKPPSPFDRVSKNIGQLWAFISHHQAYHIGQIGLLRRGFGKEPMSYQ